MTTSASTKTTKTVKEFPWVWQNRTFDIVYETRGTGSPILLLPAFSTVSSRSEMEPLGELLASQYQVTSVDWFGFGDSAHPPVEYRPIIYKQMLKDFVTSCFDQPVIIVTAGHTAGYALHLAKQNPELVAKLVLVAPTWIGPLRAMGLPEILRTFIRQIVRSPLLGQILYGFNTTEGFLRRMYSRHVYIDQNKLTPEFIKEKQKVTQKAGARYGAAAFVTGHLDPVATRPEFLAYLSGLSIPVLVIVAENAPPISKAEMEAMAAVETVQSVTLPGTLGMQEEYATQIGEAIIPFLKS